MSNKYTVTWSIDVEVDGDYKAAAQAVADRYFQANIAAGEHDSACSFVVTAEETSLSISILRIAFRTWTTISAWHSLDLAER